MITLNAEKGLIRVNDWQEIEGRPGFVPDLDPALHKLAAIIGQYVFADKIRCGLSNCHTPHGRGYIVVTQDGHETNIGKDCGKTHFGVQFEGLARTFDRDVTAKERRERLQSFRLRSDAVQAAIIELRHTEKGADWVHRHTQPLLARRRGCPDSLVDRLAAMVRARQSVLTIEREATKEEIDREEAMSGKRPSLPYYIEEPVAEIAGLPALYNDNNLRAILVTDLQQQLDAFRQVQIDTLTSRELGNWVKWTDSVDRKLERARDSVAHGRRLLDPLNLEPFRRVLDGREDQLMFRVYLRALGGT